MAEAWKEGYRKCSLATLRPRCRRPPLNDWPLALMHGPRKPRPASGTTAWEGGMEEPTIRTPDQRLRLFVSSTLAELAEERARHARHTPLRSPTSR
jgi:hypothetical protein